MNPIGILCMGTAVLLVILAATIPAVQARRKRGGGK
jgi:hypothetical protein